MERLLTISSDYWSNYINIEAEMTRDYGTPRLSEGELYECIFVILFSTFSSWFSYIRNLFSF
jgi:hypothetical protein